SSRSTAPGYWARSACSSEILPSCPSTTRRERSRTDLAQSTTTITSPSTGLTGSNCNPVKTYRGHFSFATSPVFLRLIELHPDDRFATGFARRAHHYFYVREWPLEYRILPT